MTPTSLTGSFGFVGAAVSSVVVIAPDDSAGDNEPGCEFNGMTHTPMMFGSGVVRGRLIAGANVIVTGFSDVCTEDGLVVVPAVELLVSVFEVFVVLVLELLLSELDVELVVELLISEFDVELLVVELIVRSVVVEFVVLLVVLVMFVTVLLVI